MKFFTKTNTTIAGAAVILAGASFISRIIGMLRDRIFAHQFGASDVIDAYYAAFRIPDFIYNLLIVGAIAAGFIPVFVKLWQKQENNAWRAASGVLNVLGTTLILISGIVWLLMPFLIDWIAPGFSPEKQALTLGLTRVMLISPVLLGISSIVGSVLQSFRAFFVYAMTPIFYNIGVIIGATAFLPIWGPIGLAWGVALGSALHLAIQIPTLLTCGFHYTRKSGWRNPDVRKIILLVIPRTLGLAAGQLNLLATTIIASTIGTGAIAVFHFANNLQSVPVGIIGSSIAVAAFPAMAAAAGRQDIDQVKHHILTTANAMLLLVVPFTVIFILLRAQIVRVVLGTGAFNWNNTIATADTLALFSLSLFAQILILLLVRAFYVFEDTKTPFLISIIAAGVNIGGSLLLKDAYGVYGLAMAFSIAAVLQLTLLWLLLRKKIGPIAEMETVRTLLKISAAAMIMAPVVQSLKEPISYVVNMTKFWGIFTQGFFSGAIGICVYAVFLFLFRVPEVQELLASITARNKKIPDTLPEQELR